MFLPVDPDEQPSEYPKDHYNGHIVQYAINVFVGFGAVGFWCEGMPVVVDSTAARAFEKLNRHHNEEKNEC